MKLIIIPQDKANHFIYGFVIFIVANMFFNEWISLGIVSLFGISKEIKDQITYNGFDYKDFLATIAAPILIIVTNKL